MTDTMSSSNFSSSVSLHPPSDSCYKINIFGLITLNATYILFLLPLFIFVLYIGYQRWRKLHSISTAATNSHSDIFTVNMVFLELFGILGTCLYSYGAYCNIERILMTGVYILAIISPAQTLFHLFTCLDRYLAIVHPITYRSLKEARRVRIRNVVIGCVWMFCLTLPGSTIVAYVYMAINILLLTFSTVVASFCSISVLCVLIRPGPGEAGGNRDQTKQRAFHTIVAITVALFSRFSSILVINTLLLLSVISNNNYCVALSTTIWFSLPSSLVLPLLFLQRAGKLPGSKKKHGPA